MADISGSSVARAPRARDIPGYAPWSASSRVRRRAGLARPGKRYLLTDKLIRRGVHTSVQALENDIRAWIATWNDNPRPFTWNKAADEILDSLAKYLARISGAAYQSPLVLHAVIRL